MGCRRHRGLFAEILSGLAHQRQPDIGMGKKEGLQDGSHRVYIVRVHFALPGSEKPMTEKEKPNLLLQMSPEPFSGPAAPDSCGTQQRHGLLGEPGEGSLGASWATTWQTSILNVLVNLQPDNRELMVKWLTCKHGHGPPSPCAGRMPRSTWHQFPLKSLFSTDLVY